MNITTVDGIVFLSISAGIILIVIGFLPGWKSRAYQALLIVIGLVIMLLPLQQRFFCIRMTSTNDDVVLESYPIAENGVSFENRFYGLFLGTGRSQDVYVVMAEQDDGSLDTLTLSASSVSVYEDTASWEGAHVDKVLVADGVAEGTFFGMPVNGAKVGGVSSAVYHIHVPEGTSLS